ncbi:lipid A 3-O-deacylase [Azospirillaceae bacterium]
MRILSSFVVAVGLLAAATTPSMAGSSSNSTPFSEVKAGIYAHDTFRANRTKNREENSLDFSGEILFKPIQFGVAESKALNVLLNPRPHAGFAINDSGFTHHFYGGLTWDYRFENNLFVEFGFGMGGHTGKLQARRTPDGRPSMGSPVVFREGLDLGYRFQSGHSLAIHGSHLSHGGFFAKENDGMNFAGLRYGYRFD